MTRDEEAELISEVERAQSQLRKSLKKSKALIADYRARMAGAGKAADPAKSIFRFKR